MTLQLYYTSTLTLIFRVYYNETVGIKPVSHCPIITESEGTQSVVQSDGIYSDCFGPIVSVSLPDCKAKFLNDNEKLPRVVGPSQTTAPITSDYCLLLSIIIFPLSKFSHRPDFSSDFHLTLRSVGQWNADFTCPFNQRMMHSRHDKIVPLKPLRNSRSVKDYTIFKKKHMKSKDFQAP